MVKEGITKEKTTKAGRLVKFTEGSVILHEGEMSVDMFKIINGHAELYTGYGTKNELLLGIIGPQSCFGEFGLLLHKPAIYTVIAYSDIYALRISEANMAEFIKENHKNIMDIMRNMANTMMVMQVQIALLTEEIEKGKKPDDEFLKQARRNIRSYAIYNPNNFIADMKDYLGTIKE